MRSANYSESPKRASTIGLVQISARRREATDSRHVLAPKLSQISVWMIIRINYSRFNEPFADSVIDLFLDMHGLIFYLSISPLAGSTRYFPTDVSQRAATGRHTLAKRQNAYALPTFAKSPFETGTRAERLGIDQNVIVYVKTSKGLDE